MQPSKIIAFSRTKGAPVAPNIQQRCVDRILECHALVPTNMKVPTLSFDLRGTTAGQAFPAKHHIRLNGQLLNENTEHFIEQTVGHEWAHLAAAHLHGHNIQGHGKEWKSLMVRLGLNPARCHTYDTQKARTQNTKKAPNAIKPTPMRVVPNGVPVLPPMAKFVAPTNAIIEVVLPPGQPSSAVMWLYATKLSQKNDAPLPPCLQYNQDMLTHWIGLIKQRSAPVELT